MNRSIDWLLFAAGPNSRIAGMAEAFRGEQARWGAAEWTVLGLVVGSFVLTCWLVSIWLRRAERVRVVNDPQALFRELCKAHALDRRGRSLLRRLASEQNLANPGLLFVEQQRFAPERTEAWSAQEAAQAAKIRERLFGDAN